MDGPTTTKQRERERGVHMHMWSHDFLEPNTTHVPPHSRPLFPMIFITTLCMVATCISNMDPPWAPQKTFTLQLSIYKTPHPSFFFYIIFSFFFFFFPLGWIMKSKKYSKNNYFHTKFHNWLTCKIISDQRKDESE